MNRERVLVTGATGFLGSRLVALLLKKKYVVIALKRASSDTQRLSKVLKHPSLTFIEAEQLKTYFQNHQVNFIVHVATSYGRQKDSLADVIEVNIRLPLRLLDLGKKHGVQAFVNADTFFKPNLGLNTKEKSYITTKKEFLKRARKAVQKTPLKFVNMRIEQMYGPGDNKEKFVNLVLKVLMSGEESLSLSKGNQKRDFVYVDDVAEAFVKTLQHYKKLKNYEEFGIGFGKSISIKNAVETMRRLTKSKAKLNWGALPHRKNEIMDSKATLRNNKKISWKASTAFASGLSTTIKSLKK